MLFADSVGVAEALPCFCCRLVILPRRLSSHERQLSLPLYQNDSCQQHFPLTYLTSFCFSLFLPSDALITIPLHQLLDLIPLSSFVCKGPLLSSLREALIRSATMNKEGKRGRERERGDEKKRYGKAKREPRRSGVNQSGARGYKGP